MASLLDSIAAVEQGNALAGYRNQLMCYYKLNDASGNPVDTLGNGPALTASGSLSYQQALSNGLSGIKLQTTGGSDYLNTTTVAKLRPNRQMTCSFWFDDDGGGANGGAFLHWGTNSSNRFLPSSHADTRLYVFDGAARYMPAAAIFDNAAHHVVFVIDGTTYSSWVNGVYHGSVGGGAKYWEGFSNFSVAAQVGTATTGQQGIYSELSLWQGILSPAAIVQLYNSGTGADPRGI